MDKTTIIQLIGVILGSGILGGLATAIYKRGKQAQREQERQELIKSLSKEVSALREIIDNKASKLHERINGVVSVTTDLVKEISIVEEGLKERLRQLDKAEEQVTSVVSAQIAIDGSIKRLESDIKEVRIKADALNREVGEIKSTVGRK